MTTNKIKPQTLLSTLWIVVLFSMVFRDLHEFLRKGSMEEMMDFNMSEETVLFYGFMAELPILMVLFSRLLPNKLNKWTNIVVAGITMLGILSTVPAGDMDDIFFAIVEAAILGAIMLIAWKLPALDITLDRVE